MNVDKVCSDAELNNDTNQIDSDICAKQRATTSLLSYIIIHPQFTFFPFTETFHTRILYSQLIIFKQYLRCCYIDYIDFTNQFVITETRNYSHTHRIHTALGILAKNQISP